MSNTVVRLKNAAITQQQRLVLKSVNLTINKGEFVYLIGRTGSGKSTLLKTLYGALPLNKGEGTVAEFNLKTLKRKELPKLRRSLGIVFQEFNLLSDRNVEQNLRFVLQATGWKDKHKMQSRIINVLNKVDMDKSLTAMPYELSGGEQQRVMIARALLNDPQLIIADEPTGNLDPETSRNILSLIRELSLRQDTAVLFATHDHPMIEEFPARIIRANAGKIIDEEKLVG